MTQEEKENIIYWFEHIAQIADDRKTGNGVVMEDWAALDEIKAIAKDSIYYIQNHITPDVKKVDLEKEFDNYTKNIFASDVQFEPFTHLYNCAKYFYELGLKAKEE